MPHYFITFPSGFLDNAVRLLIQSNKQINILYQEDGFVLFSSKSPLKEKLSFATNQFYLCTFGKVKSQLPDAILQQLDMSRIYTPNKAVSFRIMVSNEGQTASINPKVLSNTEKRIMLVTGQKVNRNKPSGEYWLYIRRSGKWFFGYRETTTIKKEYAAGELKYEISELVTSLIQTTEQSVILDPFAGSGSLLEPIVKNGKYKKIIFGDIDKANLRKLTERFANQKNMFIKKMDATNMSEIATRSIDFIITDPPWGRYKKYNIDKLYSQMLSEFERIMKVNSRLIVITAATKEFDKAIGMHNHFKVIMTKKILISGQKACLYLIQ